MATLSVKVTTADRDRFEQWCEDQGGTVSSLLREFVRMAPKSQRYEVCHPEVGPSGPRLGRNRGCAACDHN